MESRDEVLGKSTVGSHVQPYSWEQHVQLERYFKMDAYPDRNTCSTLGTRLDLTTEIVSAWFDKRRALQVLLSALDQRPRWHRRMHPRTQRRLRSRSSRLWIATCQYRALRARSGRGLNPGDQSCPYCSLWGFPEDQPDVTPTLESFQRLSVSPASAEQQGDAVVNEDSESEPQDVFFEQ